MNVNKLVSCTLLLLLATLLLPPSVNGDITGTDPFVGSCLCTTGSANSVTDAACGTVIDEVHVDQCFRYTGVKVECLLNEQYVEYFRVDYTNDQMAWLGGEYLRNDAAGNCGAAVDERQYIIIGDWGEIRLSGQEAVANAMGNWSLVNLPAYIVSTGDNIYPIGISSWDDPQVDIKWRDVYTQPTTRDLVWKMSLGNHDFGEGRGWEWNQVELSQHEPRWVQPHLWYDFVESVGDHSVHFVVIDTESYRDDINNATSQMVEWMERTLSESNADWKLVVGHRTVFSVGNHGPVTEDLLQELVPIMERNGVAAYICGHDHNLQHIRNMTGAGMDYVVSGAGGAGIYLYRPGNEDYIKEVYGMETPFFEATWGFVGLISRKKELVFDYFSKDNTFLYSFTRSRLVGR